MQAQILAIIIWTLLTTANVIMLALIINTHMEQKAHRKEILDMDMKFLREEHEKVMSGGK